MGFQINVNQLVPLLKNFHTITRVRTALFSSSYEEVVHYPLVQSEFCSRIRSTEDGFARCMHCDRVAFEKSAKSEGPYTYFCHAGLMESIVSIRDDNKKNIAYLMIGQFLPDTHPIDELWKKTSRSCREYASIEDLKKWYYSLPVLSADQIEASTQIMRVCASYIWLKQYVLLSNTEIFNTIAGYIAKNLTEEITADAIARELLIPRNKIFASVKHSTGMSLGKYISMERMSLAKTLLETTDSAVSEIAFLCGVDDFNYFTRLFKQTYGQSPREYRKALVKKPESGC